MERRSIGIVAPPSLGHIVHVFLSELANDLRGTARELTIFSPPFEDSAQGLYPSREDLTVRPMGKGPRLLGLPLLGWAAGRLVEESRNARALRRHIDGMSHVFFVGAGNALLSQRIVHKAGIPHTVLAWGRQSETYRTLAEEGTALERAIAKLRMRVSAALERRSLELADRIIVESPSIVETLRLGPWEEKIQAIPVPGIDTDRFASLTAFQDREYDAAFVGRVTAQKGVLQFLRAVSRLTMEGHELSVLLHGNGDLADEVDRLIAELQLGDIVDRSSWDPELDMVELYNQARILVLPTAAEGLPRSLREAMACEVVVMATPVGGIPDLLEDGTNGYLLEDRAPRTIADAVKAALDWDTSWKVAREARETIRSRYSKEAVGSEDLLDWRT